MQREKEPISSVRRDRYLKPFFLIFSVLLIGFIGGVCLRLKSISREGAQYGINSDQKNNIQLPMGISPRLSIDKGGLWLDFEGMKFSSMSQFWWPYFISNDMYEPIAYYTDSLNKSLYLKCIYHTPWYKDVTSVTEKDSCNRRDRSIHYFVACRDGSGDVSFEHIENKQFPLENTLRTVAISNKLDVIYELILDRSVLRVRLVCLALLLAFSLFNLYLVFSKRKVRGLFIPAGVILFWLFLMTDGFSFSSFQRNTDRYIDKGWKYANYVEDYTFVKDENTLLQVIDKCYPFQPAVILSSDGGNHWTEQFSLGENETFTAALCASDTLFLVTYDNGEEKSFLYVYDIFTRQLRSLELGSGWVDGCLWLDNEGSLSFLWETIDEAELRRIRNDVVESVKGFASYHKLSKGIGAGGLFSCSAVDENNQSGILSVSQDTVSFFATPELAKVLGVDEKKGLVFFRHFSSMGQDDTVYELNLDSGESSALGHIPNLESVNRLLTDDSIMVAIGRDCFICPCVSYKSSTSPQWNNVSNLTSESVALYGGALYIPQKRWLIEHNL